MTGNTTQAAAYALAGALGLFCPPAGAGTVLVEAEAFEDVGGWVIDQQFMDQMGSPFLLAHGLGVPVADAKTTVQFPAAGTYRVWVRTRDWVWMSKAPRTAGLFKLVVDGKTLDATFGTTGKDWHWQDGGTVTIDKAGAGAVKVPLALHDLTGFEGRCDAICFSSEAGFAPPEEAKALEALRRKLLGLPAEPEAAGEFDLVVVGGGTAGISAAVAAARLGLKVALIQDRPVLGGNNSSEVRVWLGGQTNLAPWPRIGDLDREYGRKASASPGKADEFGDSVKLAFVQDEKNISLLLNWRAVRVAVKDGRIVSVDARHVVTGKDQRFIGKWFADCTGDGCIGALAGADSETTPTGHMGASNMWRPVDAGTPQAFPRCPWAHQVDPGQIPRELGTWFWESGFNYDTLANGEHIRDNNLRGMYGAWDTLKNVAGKYPNHRLEWAAFVAGKRESRRLLGDVILTKQDVLGSKDWPDGCVPCTWSIDLHLPTKPLAAAFGDDAFISHAIFTDFKKPYWLPYRCLYSRNVSNLFLAGRCISVTHEALGTVRVMRTTGMMGEIVGMAASVCKEYDTTPRGVWSEHLAQLQDRMRKGVGKLPPVTAATHPSAAARAPAKLSPPAWLAGAGPNLARDARIAASSTLEARYAVENLADGKINVAANGGRWVSARSMPQHVELTWEAPRKIGAARIVTGFLGDGGIGDPIADFVLQTHDGTGWKDIPGAKATGNAKTDWSATFEPVTAGRLRLLITASPSDTARIWELEVYGPPPAAAK